MAFQVSALTEVFFLAMSLNPSVQQRAQAQLDAVVGSGRLPDFGDRPALPYIDAIVREALRWMPIVPLGIAHRTVEDDEFGGFFIPKGSTLIPNIWYVHGSLSWARCSDEGTAL